MDQEEEKAKATPAKANYSGPEKLVKAKRLCVDLAPRSQRGISSS